MSADEYVLRPRDREEISRLEHQHQVWKEETDRVVRGAGFGKGDRVLDLGCGPGHLSLDLADLVGPAGSLLAIDTSERFLEHLRYQAKSRDLSWLCVELADARELEVPNSSIDGAICRWMLMFVADPEKVIANVARALRPGGVFAVMEYAKFRTMSLQPSGESFRRLYRAVYDLITGSGGDPDIGLRIPGLLTDAGFQILELLPILRVGRPGSPLWDWLDLHNRNHPNLVEAGHLTEAELDAYYREWEERSADPAAFFTAPPVLATIARKR